jgi:hypothetical protein
VWPVWTIPSVGVRSVLLSTSPHSDDHVVILVDGSGSPCSFVSPSVFGSVRLFAVVLVAVRFGHCSSSSTQERNTLLWQCFVQRAELRP